MTMEQVAAEAGCLPETVFYWLRKHGIPTRSRAEALSKRVEKRCENCGAAIQVKPAVANRGYGRFCSRPCHYEFARHLTAEEVAKHVKARELLNAAVAAGRVQRPEACSVCESPGHVGGHHHDYDRPYDVEWLCPPCHGAKHRKRQP